MNTTISIIMPVYNVRQYLDCCMESLAEQTKEGCEVICVNDGSTDGSRQRLSEWAEQLPQLRIIDQPNQGVSAARNTGLREARGEYVLYVDSDDWLEPTTIATLREAANGQDIIGFGCRRSDTGDSFSPEAGCFRGWDYYNSHALSHHEIAFVCVWQRCYRREFLLKHGLFFRDGVLHEDNYFTPLAFFYAGKVCMVDAVLYDYRVREGSIMTTRGLKSKESLVIIGNELSARFNKESEVDTTVVYQSLTQCYQMAFADSTREEDRHLCRMVNWTSFLRVSRTKVRHRVNFLLILISPALFRRVMRTKVCRPAQV